MPRNLSGVYTLPAGNPVVPGTTIDANWANSTLADISNELTNSLSRTGAGGMLAPFRIDDGNVTGPGLAFLNETNTGYFRSGAGATAFSVLGVSTLQLNTTAVTVPSNRTLNAQGNSLVGGTLGVTGAATFSSTVGVTGALTATGGVLGNITAASGTSTFNNVVINGSLDMVAGSSATITGLSTPTNSSDAANKGYVDTQDALKLDLAGGTMSGNIAMGNNLITGLGTAVSGGDATNKTYVDGQIATRLALAGGTMSGAIAMGTNKITGLGTPTADADAATKAYVDSVAQGLDVKGSCRAATTGNITLSGTQTIDGVAVIAGDRVLVKDQSTAANNGIYVAAAGSWSRAADANTWDELVGAFVFIEDGTVNDNSGWVCTVAPGGTLGVTAVTFEQFSGAGQITAGAGLTKTGNTLNVGTASASRIVVNTDDIDLATTGVGAGTYKSVTVDTYGRVTAGTNPTTLSGYGITDAYTQTQTDTLLNAKLSLTGGTMSGALAMGTNKITGLGNPTNAQDAATKTYVDTADALKLNLTGGTMSGALAMGTNRITGMGDPVNAQDAATKNYIDTIFGSTASAAASAAAAASSASSASSSASSASSSASSASSSASTASTALFNFRAQYLGPLASDPTVDGNGNPVSTGDLYFNTTASETRVYNGSAWVAAYLPGSTYAALASANVFTANQTITANTSNDALKITQTGSGNALYIEDVAADATPFVVSSTGAVGIGTTTPDNVTSAGIALVSNNGFYPQVVNRNKSNDTTASYLVFDKDRAGSIVQNGDALGAIVWRSFDGANYLQSSAIIGYSDGAPGTNDVPGSLVFFTTADGASSPTERYRISNNGAQTWTVGGSRAMDLTSTGLGIGTSSPFGRLAVVGSAVGAGIFSVDTDATRVDIQSYNKPLAINRQGNNTLLNEGGGNVGIGTSSPTGIFNIKTSNGQFLVQNGTSANQMRISAFNNAGNANAALIFEGYSSEYGRFDSSGNLGLGVTPSAWGGGYKGLQVTAGASLGSNGANAMALGQNWFYNGTNDIYLGNFAASVYQQLNGSHRWYTAPSGTAGNAISFTQAMTLDGDGNLNIRARTNNATTSFRIKEDGGTDIAEFSANEATGEIRIGGILSNYFPTFYSSNAERARINSSGDFLVGTTSATQGSGNGNKLVSNGAVWVVNAATGDGFSYYNSSAAAYRFYVSAAGTISATNTTISAISDQRFKENIVDLDVGLDAVMALKPRKFDWKAGKGKDIKGDRGFIAQEFEQVFPDLIDEWKDPAPEGEEPYKSVRQDLIPVLVKAIQELKAQNDDLRARVAQLEAK